MSLKKNGMPRDHSDPRSAHARVVQRFSSRVKRKRIEKGGGGRGGGSVSSGGC